MSATTESAAAIGLPDDLPPLLTSAEDFLGLSPQKRYEQIATKFEPWLLANPIVFPPLHETFGFACRIPKCNGGKADSVTRGLCVEHAKGFSAVRHAPMSLDTFVTQAVPVVGIIGWALVRRPNCAIDCDREIDSQNTNLCGACMAARREARKNPDFDEATWRSTQTPRPAFGVCVITKCVHDGERLSIKGNEGTRLCTTHYQNWKTGKAKRGVTWAEWKAATEAGDSVATSVEDARGTVDLSHLPAALAREFRYGLHSHARNARRTEWRPVALRDTVALLVDLGVETLRDPALKSAADNYARGSMMRRILLELPNAARALTVTAQESRDEGWFVPLLVGATNFKDVHERTVPWDLTQITQRWLRDLTWDHLQDASLATKGKPGASMVSIRVKGVVLLSAILERICSDAARDKDGVIIEPAGSNPTALGRDAAKAVKDTWDLWFTEQVPLPGMRDGTLNGKPTGVLTKVTRHSYMSGMRTVLNDAHEKGRTPRQLDQFIFNLPEYQAHKPTPRPRPIEYSDFQLMIDPANLAELDFIDAFDVGFSDIWYTQAFQGGRISETCSVRLGCIGMVGLAQPYFWRDISKVGLIDYGVPCHLPVYERLLDRQEKNAREIACPLRRRSS